MSPESLNPNPQVVRVDHLATEGDEIVLSLSAIAESACCPKCGLVSRRVHSRYRRTVRDLPWLGAPVRLEILCRRFFCVDLLCDRKVFVEQLPGVTARSSVNAREKLSQFRA